MMLVPRAVDSDNENDGKLVEKGRVRRENKVEPKADAVKLIGMLCTYTERDVVGMVNTTFDVCRCALVSSARRHI